jgi:hypothetical protein
MPLDNVNSYLKLLVCNVGLMARYYLGNVKVPDQNIPIVSNKLLAS